MEPISLPIRPGANKSTALALRDEHPEHPERYLSFDYNDIKNRITVRPAQMGAFELEGPFTGVMNGCSCISVAGAIRIFHSMDDTLRITIKGIGEIKNATMFSVVETGEFAKQMQIRPGGNQGTLRIAVAGVQMDIDGQMAVLIPENSRDESASLARARVA